jgi:hypothetical protein
MIYELLPSHIMVGMWYHNVVFRDPVQVYIRCTVCLCIGSRGEGRSKRVGSLTQQAGGLDSLAHLGHMLRDPLYLSHEEILLQHRTGVDR